MINRLILQKEAEFDPFLLPSTILDGTSRIAQIGLIDAKMAELEAAFMEEVKRHSKNEAAVKVEHMRRQKHKELNEAADKVEATDSDAETLWKINFNILDRIYRDRLLLEVLINDVGIDEAGEKIMRAAFGFCMKLQDGNASNATGKFFTVCFIYSFWL